MILFTCMSEFCPQYHAQRISLKQDLTQRLVLPDIGKKSLEKNKVEWMKERQSG